MNLASMNRAAKKPLLLPRLLLLVLLGLLTAPVAWAQAPAPVWQGTIPVTGKMVAVPGTSGDVYVAGIFYHKQSFGTFSLTSEGRQAIFVARWSGRTHQFLWAKQAACGGTDQLSAIAAAGTSVYLAGAFGDTIQFGETELISEHGVADGLFVVKLTDDGAASHFVWAQQNGRQDLTSSRRVMLAVNGANVYLAGNYDNSISLGNVQLTSMGEDDGYVARLTDEGNTSHFAWAVRAGGAGQDELHALAVVGTKIYVAGTITNEVTLGTIHLSREGTGTNMLVARLDDVGAATTFTWAEQMRYALQSQASALLATGDTLYVVGNCWSAPGLGLSDQATSPPATMELLKLHDTGTTMRVVCDKSIPATSTIEGYGLARHGASLYVIGYFDGSIRVGRHKMRGKNPFTLFLAKFEDVGSTINCAWAQQFSEPKGVWYSGLTITGAGLLYMALDAKLTILYSLQTWHKSPSRLPPPRALLLPTTR